MGSSRGTRRVSWPSVAVLLVLTVTTVWALATRSNADPSPGLSQDLPATVETTTPPSTASAEDARAANVGSDQVVALPDARILGRKGATKVWTGAVMIVWGGTWSRQSLGFATNSTLDNGAAYDPAAATWRPLPAAPLSGRTGAAGIWTGQETIVWGGTDNGGELADGAAYDPALDHWRRIAPAPLALDTHSVLWTGSDMLVVGEGQAMAYRPATDTWRMLAPPPITEHYVFTGAVWTGTLAVYSVDAPGKPAATPGPLLYDPARDAWTAVPVTVPFTNHVNVLAWTGQYVFVHLATSDPPLYRAFDPVSQTFTPLSDPPEWGGVHNGFVWTGTSAMYLIDDRVYAFVPSANAWRVGALAEPVIDPVWADGFVLGWGPKVDTASVIDTTDDHGTIYRPPDLLLR